MQVKQLLGTGLFSVCSPLLVSFNVVIATKWQ